MKETSVLAFHKNAWVTASALSDLPGALATAGVP